MLLFNGESRHQFAYDGGAGSTYAVTLLKGVNERIIRILGHFWTSRLPLLGQFDSAAPLSPAFKIYKLLHRLQPNLSPTLVSNLRSTWLPACLVHALNKVKRDYL